MVEDIIIAEDILKDNFPFDYKYFLQNILAKIQSVRYQMLMSVSKQTLMLYWDIGRAVSEKMQSAGWGAKVVKQLSKDLQTEFPGIRGFSVRNLWRMKMLYEFYAEFGICATAVAQIPNSQDSATAVAELQKNGYELITSIGWVQNCVILEKCKSKEQVIFYLKQAKEKGWSKLDLLEKIEQNYFENHALAQNNFEATVPELLKAQVAWEFLDDYNIELINPDQPVSEKALENAIIENLVKFLHEMGGTFAFVGRQFRLTLDEKEYFVDLLFFNLTLNRYVVFELKAREFSPKDIGQTQMYMQLINKQVKQPFHNSTIGVIVCRAKNRLEVEYMLELAKDPMGVATYNNYSKLPEEYAKYLPSEEELEKRLSSFIQLKSEK
ncbi:MAG: PDDEXK nuclease domain-containing protein [Prevotellaceae bacterium]|jgi:predicted nuclease of restriction endonuclease-like (RecB) superfamily|nr:PDDEXK nuclease domain-containing protein [Prevotellaceae bacterium]